MKRRVSDYVRFKVPMTSVHAAVHVNSADHARRCNPRPCEFKWLQVEMSVLRWDTS